jgi:hypothetical protein
MMNGNFYGNERLVNIRHAERIAEAEAFRRAKLVEQSSTVKQPDDNLPVRSFGWFRRLAWRFGGTSA